MEMKDVLIYANKLKKYCSKETCYPKQCDFWSEENPFLGHSAIIELCIHSRFGGKICRGEVDGSKESHYWNEIDEEMVDVTKVQFGDGVEIKFANYKIKKEMLKNKNFKERYLKFTDKLKKDFVV